MFGVIVLRLELELCFICAQFYCRSGIINCLHENYLSIFGMLNFDATTAKLNIPIFPFNRAVAPLNRTVSPFNRDVAPINRMVSPFHRAVAPLNRTVSPFNRAVAPLLHHSFSTTWRNQSHDSHATGHVLFWDVFLSM